MKGIVIAGSGKAFLAGADIRFFVRHIEAGTIDAIARFTERGQALLRAFETCPKPVIARLHGLALGGGVELALACHAIVATPKASLAFPETGIGIYPGLGGTQRTPRRVGRGLAKWLVLSGQTIGAEEALAIGMVDKVVAYEQLDATIQEVIAAGPKAVRGPKPVPDSHRSIASFFDRHDVDELLAGQATLPEDASLAKSVKRIGAKAPVALRLSAELDRPRRGSAHRAGNRARAFPPARNLRDQGRVRGAVEPRAEDAGVCGEIGSGPRAQGSGQELRDRTPKILTELS